MSMDEQQQPSTTDGSGTDALHAECQKQLADVDGRWKRAVADYANREKELAREREEFAKFCTVDIIRDVLPIVDAVSAASGGKTSGVDGRTSDVEEPASGVEEYAARRGFRAIQVLLRIFLKRHGVEPIGAIGDRVDYLLHEVVGTRSEEGKEAGSILEVVQVGYTMHGKLLRPAKVIVCEEKK